jgi:Gluconate 2-dehydrogenase subunit 3
MFSGESGEGGKMMKRRSLLGGLAAIPLAAPLAGVAQEQAAKAPSATAAPSETPTIPTVAADAAADGSITCFNAAQLAALERLAEIIGTSAAKDASAATFLDFLISRSPADRMALYKDGLDRLNADAMKRYQRPFDKVTVAEAEPLLGSLQQPWTYHEPSDPQAKFLRAAKNDILTATVNSREYIAAVSKRRRGGSGTGQYWFPIE